MESGRVVLGITPLLLESFVRLPAEYRRYAPGVCMRTGLDVCEIDGIDGVVKAVMALVIITALSVMLMALQAFMSMVSLAGWWA